MKHFLVAASSLLVSVTYAQEGTFSGMYENDNPNPAVSGLYYRHHVAVNGYFSPFWTSTSANYGARVKALHGGIGVQYSQLGNFSHTGLANYNFQFQLPGERVLSVGVGGGAIFNRMSATAFGPSSPRFLALAGVAYKGTHLDAGFYTNVYEAPIRYPDGPTFNAIHTYRFNVGYRFDLGERFSLIPRASLETSFNNDGYNSGKIGVLATYNRKLWLSADFLPRTGFEAGIGWDISERFRVGYTLGVYYSHLNYGDNGLYHRAVLGFQLR